jgi:putative heme iron utilization protein
MTQPTNPADIQQTAQQFRAQFQSVTLATLSESHLPDVSYAPFLLDKQQRTYVFISLLAQHTKNLINNPHASLLWLADEQDSPNIFARERLTLHCTASLVEQDNPNYNQRLDQLQQRHGETIALLRTLQDFRLFRFEADSGLFVQGFGKAFPVSGNSLLPANN